MSLFPKKVEYPFKCERCLLKLGAYQKSDLLPNKLWCWSTEI